MSHIIDLNGGLRLHEVQGLFEGTNSAVKVRFIFVRRVDQRESSTPPVVYLVLDFV